MSKSKLNPRLRAPGLRRKELLENEGCAVPFWRQGRGGHLKFRVVLPNGTERTLVCPSSPSDGRGEKNMVALVRRWISEEEQC